MQTTRLYVCYGITTVLISFFIYTLIYSNFQNAKKLERLREEVDDIAHLLIQNPPYNDKAEPKHLTDIIDNFIKKRLAGVWDDLYAIKKQLKGLNGISAIAATKSANKNGEKVEAAVKTDEKVNYASEELGAKIIGVIAEPICPGDFLKAWLGLEFSTNPPIYMLSKNMEPGKCFGFRASKAEVIIGLAEEISVQQIAIQHITKNQSPIGETTSAPKDFQVFGLQNNNKDEIHLGSFRFENNNPLQSFDIHSDKKFRNLRFQFDSNHGHPEYTCVYRVAVYGQL